MSWFIRTPSALVLAAAFVSTIVAARADPPVLDLPLRCAPGRTCWIANYTDDAPGAEPRDYRCGNVTYHEHNGTDFAIRNQRVMRAAVEVVAAASGRVLRTRDGVQDRNVRETGPEAVAGRECGNGLLIDHGDGWQTQYCHMHEGSIRVHPGEPVERGAVLGLIGMSGLTEYPHVHLTVRHNDVVIDPFLGRAGACGAGATPLWSPAVAAALPYRTGVVFDAGFAGEEPSAAGVADGDYDGRPVGSDAAFLCLWMRAWAIEPGDTITLRITAPDGQIVAERSEKVARHSALAFRFIGRRRTDAPWPRGTYSGEIEYRGAADASVRRTATSITVE